VPTATATATHADDDGNDDDDFTEVAFKHVNWIKVVRNRETATGF